MRVYHLNCISTCPLGGKLMDGRTDSIVRRGELASCRRHSREVSVFCGHDVVEFARLSGRSARVPAEKIVRAMPPQPYGLGV